jgi:hypothetical protein
MGIKRYSLALPDEVFNELQCEANRRGKTVVDLLRKFIKLGLIVLRVEDNPNAEFIIREGDKETRVVLY